MDMRVYILAGTFALFLVAVIAFIVSVINARRASRIAPPPEFQDWDGTAYQPRQLLDTSLDGLHVAVSPGAPSAALTTPLKMGEWMPPATPATAEQLSQASLSRRIAGYVPPPDVPEPSFATETRPAWEVSQPQALPALIVEPEWARRVPEVQTAAPPVPIPAPIDEVIAELEPADGFDEEIAALLPTMEFGAVAQQNLVTPAAMQVAPQPPAPTLVPQAAQAATPPAVEAPALVVPPVSAIAAPVVPEPVVVSDVAHGQALTSLPPVEEPVAMPAAPVSISPESVGVPIADVAPEPAPVLTVEPGFTYVPDVQPEPLAITVPANEPVFELVEPGLADVPVALTPSPDAMEMPVLTPAAPEPLQMPAPVVPAVEVPSVELPPIDVPAALVSPTIEPIAAQPAEPAPPEPGEFENAFWQAALRDQQPAATAAARAARPEVTVALESPVQEPPVEVVAVPVERDRVSRPRARVNVPGSATPVVAPEIAPGEEAGIAAAHAPIRERDNVTEIVMAAPVEMWFGDARVGVKAGTATYDRFRKYADVLFADLRATGPLPRS